MNKNRYLQELAYYLRSLPKNAQDELLAYYRNQFEQGEKEGRSEEDTALLLGRPKANAEKELAIHAEQRKKENMSSETHKNHDQGVEQEHFNQKQNQGSNQSSSQSINYAMLILLIVVNVVFVLGPAVGLFFGGLGLWFSSIVLMATPMIAFWTEGMLSFPTFYPILAAVGLGILMFVGMYYLSQLAFRLTKAYFNAMDRMVRGN